MRRFRPLSSRTLRWRSSAGEGLEHLKIDAGRTGFTARGLAIGGVGAGFGVCYTLACDARWRARSLEAMSADGRELALSSDGEGHWRDSSGEPMPMFDGCVDVDLSGTPLTNTLPIRRLGLKPGQTTEIEALYVSFADFALARDAQRYTCVELARRYRYEAVDGSFVAEIDVDDEGLVLNYPPLFVRADNTRA
jgi:hypothetical protein